MPCTQCKEGKYKWGETGECEYETLQDCEDANHAYEEMKTTKIVELIIEDDNQELAIDAISLVSAPAIEQDMVFFGKEKNNLTFAKVDKDKRIVVSPALIPNKQIFRYDPNTDSEYYVYFSPETVRKASELYLRHNNHHKATYEHADRVSGVLTVESWIKEGDMDKSKLFGYDLPNGTWFVKMRIDNDDLWTKIKDGELRGLSIEGYFTNKFETMNTKSPTAHEILSAFNELIKEGKVKNMNLGKKLSIAKKVELKDINTLDTLEDKSYSLVREINESYDDYSYYITGEDDITEDIENVKQDASSWQDDLDEANNKVKSLEDDKVTLLKSIRSWQEEVKLSKGNIKDLNAQLKKRTSDLKTFQKEQSNALKKYKKLESQGDKLASDFAKNISSFKSTVKSLGVKADTSQYENALKELKAAGGNI